MNRFFDQLSGPTFPKLQEFVHFTAGEIGQANIEKVLVAYEQIRSSPPDALPWAQSWTEHLPRVEREFSEYTLGRLADCFELSPENWAVGLIAQCAHSTTTISLNYDNILERILSNRNGTVHRTRHQRTLLNCPHCKMRSLLETACSCENRRDIDEGDWRGAVIKPHGSIAWKRCINPECCSANCLVADEHCRPFKECRCGNCGRECVSALILPSIGKNLNSTPEIKTMWKAAWSAIQDAETIWIFGFSMPLSDELFALHTKYAIQSSRKLKQVVVIDLDPESVIARFRRCIPNDMRVEFVPLVVEPDKVPSWIPGMMTDIARS